MSFQSVHTFNFMLTTVGCLLVCVELATDSGSKQSRTHQTAQDVLSPSTLMKKEKKEGTTTYNIIEIVL